MSHAAWNALANLILALSGIVAVIYILCQKE